MPTLTNLCIYHASILTVVHPIKYDSLAFHGKVHVHGELKTLSHEPTMQV